MPMFTINIVNKKERRATERSKTSRIVYGEVIEIEGQPRISINMPKDEEEYSDIMVMPFTQSSFNPFGKDSYFMKEKDKYGHYVRIYKDEAQSASSESYDTFKIGYVVRGKIKTSPDGTRLFDLIETMVPKAQFNGNLSNVRKIRQDGTVSE